jgi:pimeloyl-ACP methyl ester carboxylesterase
MAKKDTFPTCGYFRVNGIRLYYEIYGEGNPLVLIHGGGSTIQTTFGRVIPLLAKRHKLICVELQAHGRSDDREGPLSFEQDADDVVGLLHNLGITKSDFFGFSNGGNTALQIAIRHPEYCHKIIAGSVLLKHDGAPPLFWESMKNASFEQMPAQYKAAYIAVNPDSLKLHNMYQKCADRMNHFRDFDDVDLKSISAPVLLINGDHDVASVDHISAMSRLIPHCTLAIIPGGHGEYIGEITTLHEDSREEDFIIPLIEKFLTE